MAEFITPFNMLTPLSRSTIMVGFALDPMISNRRFAGFLIRIAAVVMPTRLSAKVSALSTVSMKTGESGLNPRVEVTAALNSVFV